MKQTSVRTTIFHQKKTYYRRLTAVPNFSQRPIIITFRKHDREVLSFNYLNKVLHPLSNQLHLSSLPDIAIKSDSKTDFTIPDRKHAFISKNAYRSSTIFYSE